MPAGDHGLGTLDRLDGELVIVDGVPWQVDHTGTANRVPLDARTPFVVLTTMEDPVRVRLRDMDRAEVAAEIERLVDSAVGDGVVAVRLEGDQFVMDLDTGEQVTAEVQDTQKRVAEAVAANLNVGSERG